MLVVSVKSLQGDLGVVVNAALDTMRNMLTVAANHECSRVLSRFHDHTDALSARPSDLHGYAKFLEGVIQLEDRREELTGESKLVDDMYDMLAEYDAKVPEQDRLLVDDLKEMITSFNKAFEESTAFVEEQKEGMIETLEKDIGKLFDRLQSILSDLRSGTFDQKDGDSAEMVERLEELSKSYGEIQDLSAKYAHYQDIMQLGQTDFNSVQMAGRELKWQQDKWVALKDFEGEVKEWMSSAVWTLNPEEVQNKLDEAAKHNYKMIKTRKDDLVCARLKDQIEEFKGHMPLLSLVADPAIKERHWIDIFHLVEKEFVPGETLPSVTVSDGGIRWRARAPVAVGAFSCYRHALLLAMRFDAPTLRVAMRFRQLCTTAPTLSRTSLDVACRCWTSLVSCGTSSSSSRSSETPSRRTTCSATWTRWRRSGRGRSSASLPTRTTTSSGARTTCRPSWTTRSSRSRP